MRKINHDLPEKTRSKIVGILNKLLALHIDLYLQTKQAHWNVRGPNFIALHEMLDGIATSINGFVDELAERAVQLGGEANGTLKDVSKASTLKAYPNASNANAHLAAIENSITEVLRHLREDIDTASGMNDAVTADLLTEIASALDKHLCLLTLILDDDHDLCCNCLSLWLRPYC